MLGIVQARVSSSRLPGKVLEPLCGKPMLSFLLERVMRSRRVEQWVLATSTEKSDDPLEEIARAAGIAIFRGSLEDVLSRFYHAAKPYNARYVVRLTGDCPLMDAAIVDRVVDACLKGAYDYCSNTNPPTYPDGFDVEVFTGKALEEAYRLAGTDWEREHVTQYLIRRPELYKAGAVLADDDRSHLRLTVDQPEDLAVVRQVADTLCSRNGEFGYDDVIALLETRPELSEMNKKIKRNEGLERSIKKGGKRDDG